MEKEGEAGGVGADPTGPSDFSEQFNQLELLETHGPLIPKGSPSLWAGSSDGDEELEERSEEWYRLQEAKMETEPGKLLLWAAEKNRLSTLRRLLSERAALVNTRDADAYTPLHRAAYGGHLDAVRELVARGADVHAETLDGWTPLHSACRWNRARVAAFLLQHDADVNAQTRGLLTPLHLAAGNGRGRETLELLLMNRYVRPGLRSALRETALDVARRAGVLHYLFDIGEPCTNSVPQP